MTDSPLNMRNGMTSTQTAEFESFCQRMWLDYCDENNSNPVRKMIYVFGMNFSFLLHFPRSQGPPVFPPSHTGKRLISLNLKSYQIIEAQRNYDYQKKIPDNFAEKFSRNIFSKKITIKMCFLKEESAGDDRGRSEMPETTRVGPRKRFCRKAKTCKK